MNDVPLVNKNDINSINTSIIAIKKQLMQLNEAVGLIDTPDVNIDLTPFVKKSDVVDVVQSDNMNPVTSNAVVPVDTVTSGDMHSVTSNAVATALNGYNKNQSNFGIAPTSEILSEMDTRFSSNGDYSLWNGSSYLSQEGGWFGFKHNNTKGGICVYMTINNGFIVGKGSGLPSTWTWHRLIMW